MNAAAPRCVDASITSRPSDWSGRELSWGLIDEFVSRWRSGAATAGRLSSEDERTVLKTKTSSAHRRGIGLPNRAKSLTLEPLEPRLVLTGVEWFDLSAWDFSAMASGQQDLPEVVAGLDLSVSVDSGTFDECQTGCIALSNGSFALRQQEGAGRSNSQQAGDNSSSSK